MKSFEDVWKDIQTILEPGETVCTICKESVNDIIKVTSSGIKVRSRRSKTGKERFILKDEFKYVWEILSKEGVDTLNGLPRIIGKRSITCAILARLPYVEKECDKGRVSLRLKKKSLC